MHFIGEVEAGLFKKIKETVPAWVVTRLRDLSLISGSERKGQLRGSCNLSRSRELPKYETTRYLNQITNGGLKDQK